MNHDAKTKETLWPVVGSVIETALYVGDLNRSIRFYQQVLGLRIAEEPLERMCALSITANQVLLLFKKGGSAVATNTSFGVIPAHDAYGNQHIAFSISDADFERWLSRLRKNGIETESVLTWPGGGRSIYFRDPDNHSIELKTSNWHGKAVQTREEEI